MTPGGIENKQAYEGRPQTAVHMNPGMAVTFDELSGDFYERCSKNLLKRMEEERERQAEEFAQWVIAFRPVSPPHHSVDPTETISQE